MGEVGRSVKTYRSGKLGCGNSKHGSWIDVSHTVSDGMSEDGSSDDYE